VRSLTRAQCREIDRKAIEEYGMSGLVLMENAGRGVADLLCHTFDEQSAIDPLVLICCGKGNNGGDGFVIARHLDLRGIAVQVLVWAQGHELIGDAGVNYGILKRSGVPVALMSTEVSSADFEPRLSRANWVVDCLLGTGAQGEPRPPIDVVIDRINAANARRLAVDVPSGLDCDTGVAAQHTIRAEITATFVAMKQGFLNGEAHRFTGAVHVLDIGAPRRLIREFI